MTFRHAATTFLLLFVACGGGTPTAQRPSIAPTTSATPPCEYGDDCYAPPPTALVTPTALATVSTTANSVPTTAAPVPTPPQQPATPIWESSDSHPNYSTFTVRDGWDVHWEFWFYGDPHRYINRPSCSLHWSARTDSGSAAPGPFTEKGTPNGQGTTHLDGGGSFYLDADVNCSTSTPEHGNDGGWELKVYD